MILDAHAHLDVSARFGWDATPGRLLDLMDSAGIDRAVVTTYGDEPGPEPALDGLLSWVGDHPDRFIGFPRLDPRYGEEAHGLLDRAVEAGAGGLKLHPVSTVSSPYADQTVALMNHAAELGFPVLVHSGDRSVCLPRVVGAAARRTDATILMGHMGGFFHAREAVDVAAEHDNVVLETSVMPYPHRIREAIDRLGADRVVYGSDMPAANPVVELEKLRVLDLTDAERSRVLFQNAADLLGLEMEGAS